MNCWNSTASISRSTSSVTGLEEFDKTSLRPAPPPDADMKKLAEALNAHPSPPNFMFLLGGPGAGKGTLSSLISQRTTRKHISMGAILRKSTLSGTAEGREISATMSRGGIISSKLSTRLLLRHVVDHSHSNWVVDGFPRTFANAVMFDSLELAPALVVAMEIDESVMKERLKQRKRRDDLDYIVEQRLVQFHSEWESIKEFYKRRGLLVQIDAHGSPEQVWDRFVDVVDEQ